MATNSDLPSLDEMIRYLLTNGWEQQSCATCSKVSIFSNGQGQSLTLPRSDRFIDFEFKMRKALELLASTAHVSTNELVEIIRFATTPQQSGAPLH